MAGPAELFSIVIVGNMNPRIHHPHWYQAAGIFSAEETAAAVQSPVICTPDFATFQASGLGILCSAERWEIQTADRNNFSRVMAIAGRTFDTLRHTPVSAFGLNFQFVRSTKYDNAAERIAELVNSLPLGRRPSERDSATIVTVTPTEAGHIQETISGMLGAPNCIRITFNIEHRISIKATKPEEMIFELTPILDSAFNSDHRECVSRADRICEAIAAD